MLPPDGGRASVRRECEHPDVLGKIIPAFLMPPDVVLLLGLIALVLASLRRRKAAVALGAAGLLILWAAATPRVADAFAGPIVRRYLPTLPAASPTAGAIVILGGTLAPQ